MFNQDRNSMRQVFFDAFRKSQANESLTPLEEQLAYIIKMHPEYHFIFANPEKYQEQDFFAELGDTNPFLHMSAHLGLHEQLATNRPQGIQEIYKTLIQKETKTPHDIEHQMMEVLMQALWQAQQSGQMPKDEDYLKQLKALQ
jgi:hypothetical protein